MVTKITLDFEKHCLEVCDFYYNKFPNKSEKINEFIEYYKCKYKPLVQNNRAEYSMFNYKFAWYLFSKRRSMIKNNTHFWIIILGKKGGEGKSTLASHICNFMDDSFGEDPESRTSRTYIEFIKKLNGVLKTDYHFPALLIDEPNPSVHGMSRQGMAFREIINEVRQFNCIIAVCCNDLAQLLGDLRQKPDALCYLMKANKKHIFYMFDDDKDISKHKNILTVIMARWSNLHKHSLFDKKVMNRAYLKNQEWYQKVKLGNTYISDKRESSIKKIDAFINEFDAKTKPSHEIPTDKLITEIKLRNPNISDINLGKLVGVSRQHVNLLSKKEITGLLNNK